MTSVGVRCSLGCSQEKDFPQRNLLQRGGNTTQELLSGARFLLEVAPVEFYFLLEDECSGESSSSGVLQIHREVNFLKRKPSLVCSGCVFYRSA
jgi:hypothetical protein